MSKYNVGLKTLLQEGLPKPEFYGDYVLSGNMKNIRDFYLKIFRFFSVEFSVHLNRYVFVMHHCVCD